MIEFIQSVWAVGWPVWMGVILTPIWITCAVWCYREMRRNEGDLHKKD